jgi:hypothetical protein
VRVADESGLISNCLYKGPISCLKLAWICLEICARLFLASAFIAWSLAMHGFS